LSATTALINRIWIAEWILVLVALMSESTEERYTIPFLGIELAPDRASNVILIAVLGLVMVGSSLLTEWLPWALGEDLNKRPKPASLLLLARRPSELNVHLLLRLPIITWMTIDAAFLGSLHVLPVALLMLFAIERSPWIIGRLWQTVVDRSIDDGHPPFHSWLNLTFTVLLVTVFYLSAVLWVICWVLDPEVNWWWWDIAALGVVALYLAVFSIIALFSRMLDALAERFGFSDRHGQPTQAE